jgi:hypothetical protein
MTNAARNIDAISYKADIMISRGNEFKDSMYRFTSWVKAKAAPGDTVFGYYVHVQQNNASAKGDFCYEGREGIDIRHESLDTSQSKTVFFITPFRLRNGSNSVELSETSQGFVKELLLQHGRMLPGVLAQDIKVFDGNEFWILEWEQSDDAAQFVGRWHARVKKNTLLLSYLLLRAVKQGQPYTKKIVIQDIQVNETALPVICPVNDWSHYKVVRYTAKQPE